MDKSLYDSIYKRKSFHFFKDVGNRSLTENELNDIYDVYKKLTPLHEDIKTEIKIVPSKDTMCKRGEEYCIFFYSEKKDGYLQNIGYLGEQLDLYLVSKNIGSLWYGIGFTRKKKYNNLGFVIMMAIHKVDDETKFRTNMFKSKRKEISEIWEGEKISGVTDIVRFSPSACNSQPWLVKNEDKLFVYRKLGKRGIMPVNRVPFYNRIDIGIFLCILDLCLMHYDINFNRELFVDPGDKNELSLNAIYTLDKK